MTAHDAAGGTSMAEIRENWPQISEDLRQSLGGVPWHEACENWERNRESLAQSLGGMTMAEFGEYVASGEAIADVARVVMPDPKETGQ